MIRYIEIILLLAFSLIALPLQGFAIEKAFNLRGRVFDNGGKGVAGAEVILYTTADVRRPADFVTPQTDREGRYSIIVPPGKYWAVARQRMDGQFGPLHVGDRHSGAPVEVAGDDAEAMTVDFIVSSLREIGERREATPDTVVTVHGRITDTGGAPLTAYLYANRSREVKDIPDYISPWTDRQGTYVMALPPGKYFVGADVKFPPREQSLLEEVTLGTGTMEIVIDMEVP